MTGAAGSKTETTDRSARERVEVALGLCAEVSRVYYDAATRSAHGTIIDDARAALAEYEAENERLRNRLIADDASAPTADRIRAYRAARAAAGGAE